MPNLSTQEAALHLGVSKRRVQALITSGRLPATKFGRDWQIKPKDLTAFTPRKPGRPKKEKINVLK